MSNMAEGLSKMTICVKDNRIQVIKKSLQDDETPASHKDASLQSLSSFEKSRNSKLAAKNLHARKSAKKKLGMQRL